MLLLRLLARHRTASISAFGASMAVAVVEVILPLLTKNAVDVAVGQSDFSLTVTVAVLIGAALLRYGFQYARRLWAGVLSIDVQYQLRKSMVESVFTLDGRAQDSLTSGQVMSRSISDISAVQGMCAMVPLTAGNVVKLLLAAGAMVWLSPVLSLVALLTLPLVFALGYFSRGPLFQATLAAQQQAATVTTQVDATVTGIRTVKAFSQQDRHVRGLCDDSVRLYGCRLAVARVTAKFQPIMEQLPLAALVANIACGGWLATQGVITVGTFVAFSTYLTTLSQVTKMLSGMVIKVQTALSSLARIEEIIALRTASGFTAASAVVPRGVELALVSFDDVLDEVSFTAAPGEMLCVVGPPGSGKSLLVQLLSGMDSPDNGRISLVDAHPDRSLSAPPAATTAAELRTQVASVFEQPFLYSASIWDNLTMGGRYTAEEVERAARTAHAHEFISALPGGYDEVVGERGLTLSGGQRQRLALARALLAGRPILVLDDATSAIDVTTESRIFSAIRREYPQLTIIAVAHRASTIDLADTVVELPGVAAVHTAVEPPLPARQPTADSDCTAMATDDSPFSLWLLLGQAKLQIALVVGLLLVGVAVELSFPMLVRVAVDKGVHQQQLPTLWAATAIGAALVVVAGLVAAVRILFTARVGEQLLLRLRVRSFAHMLRLSMSYFESTTAGRVITRMTTDIDALSSFLQTGAAQTIVAGTTLVGIMGMLLITDLTLAGVTLAAMPVVLAATLVFRRISKRLYTQAREEISVVNSLFHEAFSGVRTTQAYGAVPHMLSVFDRANHRYRRTRLKAQTAVAVYFPGVHALSELTHTAVLGVGVHQVLNGELSPGVLIAFLMYLRLLFGPIQELSQLYDTYQQAQVSLLRISELLHTTPTMTDIGERSDAHTAASGPIALCDVTFSYTVNTAKVVEELNLHIDPGTTVAVVGATGAGKSTLIKLLARFYDPNSGKVTASTVDIKEFPLHQWRSALGYVPQETQMVAGTVADNIAYGKPTASPQEIVAAARAVGALPVFAALPNGLNHSAASLSSGQRQLVALARAELVHPQLLLLDEATSTLDAHTEELVAAASANLAQPRTTVVVAHRLSTVEHADRILVMDSGRIVEDGCHAELIAAGGRYADLWANH